MPRNTLSTILKNKDKIIQAAEQDYIPPDKTCSNPATSFKVEDCVLKWMKEQFSYLDMRQESSQICYINKRKW